MNCPLMNTKVLTLDSAEGFARAVGCNSDCSWFTESGCGLLVTLSNMAETIRECTATLSGIQGSSAAMVRALDRIENKLIV